MSALADLPLDEVDEIRSLWLSRVMFNMFVGWPPETRTLEEFTADVLDGEQETS